MSANAKALLNLRYWLEHSPAMTRDGVRFTPFELACFDRLRHEAIHIIGFMAS